MTNSRDVEQVVASIRRLVANEVKHAREREAAERPSRDVPVVSSRVTEAARLVLEPEQRAEGWTKPQPGTRGAAYPGAGRGPLGRQADMEAAPRFDRPLTRAAQNSRIAANGRPAETGVDKPSMSVAERVQAALESRGPGEGAAPRRSERSLILSAPRPEQGVRPAAEMPAPQPVAEDPLAGIDTVALPMEPVVLAGPEARSDADLDAAAEIPLEALPVSEPEMDELAMIEVELAELERAEAEAAEDEPRDLPDAGEPETVDLVLPVFDEPAVPDAEVTAALSEAMEAETVDTPLMTPSRPEELEALSELIREIMREEVRSRMGPRINKIIRHIVQEELARLFPADEAEGPAAAAEEEASRLG